MLAAVLAGLLLRMYVCLTVMSIGQSRMPVASSAASWAAVNIFELLDIASLQLSQWILLDDEDKA